MNFGDIGASGEASEQVKSGVDSGENRIQRQIQSVQIRKNNKNEQLRQRRRGTVAGADSTQEAPSLANIQQYIAGVNSDNNEQQLKCTQAFRKLLSIENKPPIQDVINAGVVPRFVMFLMFEHNPKLQFEAAWALTNIASGEREPTTVVVEAGAIPIFVRLLASPEDDVREQAVWALGNIAGEGAAFRDAVLNANAMPMLLRQFTPTAPTTMIENGTWTLSNLCRGNPRPPFEKLRMCLPKLKELIYMREPSQEPILADACWALSYITESGDGEEETIKAVIDIGIPVRCIELLSHPQSRVRVPALRLVGNILTANNAEPTQYILANGGLPKLLMMLDDSTKGIRKEACWAISNVAAGTPLQVRAVFEANIMPKMIELLTNDKNDIKKEVCFTIHNALSTKSPKGDDQNTPDEEMYCRQLVQYGCLRPLCDVLRQELTQENTQLIDVALQCVKAFLGANDSMYYAEKIDECEGVQALENLQVAHNSKIAELATAILNEFYDDEDVDEDASLAAEVNQSGTQFSFGQHAPFQQPQHPPSGPFGAPQQQLQQQQVQLQQQQQMQLQAQQQQQQQSQQGGQDGVNHGGFNFSGLQ